MVRRALVAVPMLALAVLAPGLRAGPALASDDPHWPRQWGPAKVGAPAAWATTTGGGVTIGVVDTGVDLAHEDLQARVVANAACIDTGGDPAACRPGAGQDVIGHGTHVAGIAAATKDNARGIAGIAPTSRLAVARVFDGDSARLDDVEAGIRWVVGQGARVVNLSLGENVLLGGLLGGGGSLEPALNAAWAAGAIPVVAAGNADLLFGSSGYGTVNAVIVGATGPDDELASYSVPTGSAKWALLAPGGNGSETDGRQVFSAWWSAGATNQYAYEQGTSMAAPHVAGALALLLSRPGMTKERAVELLLDRADRRVSCGSNSPTCAGRLDVAAAIAATLPAAPPPTTTTSAPAAPGTATTRPAPATTTATTRAPAPPVATGAKRAPRAPSSPASGAPATPEGQPAPGPTPAPAVPPGGGGGGGVALGTSASSKSDDGAPPAAPTVAAGALLVVVAAGAVGVRRRSR